MTVVDSSDFVADVAVGCSVTVDANGTVVVGPVVTMNSSSNVAVGAAVAMSSRDNVVVHSSMVVMLEGNVVLCGPVEPYRSVVQKGHHRIHDAGDDASEAGCDIPHDLLLRMDQRRDDAGSVTGGADSSLLRNRLHHGKVHDLPD